MDERLLHDCEIPHDCKLIIRGIYPGLKSAEKKAVEFIVEHAQEVPDLTVQEFGERAECSVATVVRISRRLGYKGYPDLKKAFVQAQLTRSSISYDSIGPLDPPEQVNRRIIEASVQALRDTEKVFSEKAFGKALDVLLNSSRIVFVGLGESAIVAEEACSRFTRIGVACHFSKDSDMQSFLTAHLTREESLVCISHSGQSIPVIRAVKEAKLNGAPTIAITNYPLSAVGRLADVVLQTSVFTRSFTDEIVSKRLSQLLIVECLYVNYMIRSGDEGLRKLRLSNESIAYNKWGK